MTEVAVSPSPPPIPELGRFAEPSLYILLSLSDGPKHGYAIMTDVERVSGTPLGPGTLYAALARLEDRGLIEALPQEDRRRPYRLTARGAATLETQLEQMQGFTRTALQRLRRAGS
jgi:DNA-binding PadR family transcriptional regulator